MKKLILLILISYAMGLSAQNITLPTPEKTGGKPLMQALSERQSNRNFQEKELPLQTLSNLLWAANGFNRDEKRTAPTSQNRQELELYVTLKSGLYAYDAKNNLLVMIKKGDYRKNSGKQDFVAIAPLNIIFVADLQKASSENAAHTDCGFISQNIYLFCSSEGLGTVVRGWFDKDELAKLLELPEHRKVLLTQTVGYLK